jgi:putative endonuclease
VLKVQELVVTRLLNIYALAVQFTVVSLRFEAKRIGNMSQDAEEDRASNLQENHSQNNTLIWYIYIVECQDSTYYTGMTSDLARRVKEHKTGNGSRYTKSRRPIKLKYFEITSTRSEAVKREMEIKNYSRKKKKELIFYSNFRGY